MPAPDTNINSRISKFKFQGKSDEARRKRTEVTIEMRKANKDRQLFEKRRNINFDDELDSPTKEKSQIQTMSIDEIIIGMQSTDELVQLEATQACRKMLSQEKNPPINDMIEKGIIPLCIKFLGYHHRSMLQFEACWALTNVASGTSEQTLVVIKHGAIVKLVELLKSPKMNVAEQAVWALGNIAGDGPLPRDMVLKEDALPHIILLLNPETPISFVRNIVWTLSNLCRNKNPAPPFDIVKQALPLLNRLLSYTDKDILADACWALSYLTDGPNDKIQTVLESGIVPKLVELLGSSEVTVLTPAVRVVGNIVTGNDAQTDSIIAAGGLNYLSALLLHKKFNIVKEAAWMISNITAGNHEQIQAVIDAGLIPPLIQILSTGDFKSQKEAAWAITNLTSGGTVPQLVYLVKSGLLAPFCNLLESKDWKCVNVVLDGLVHILNVAEKMEEVDKVALMIEEVGGLDKLEALQTHKNEEIYEKTLAIIDKFFCEGESDPNVLPSTNEEGQLEFQASIATPQGGFQF
ncbi:PREDICTED: importin subunit alpha-1 [Ceratosolen solmsi marchali]|uniref:Importin subunit alpha n=1 Tax=Ceratosolen solmsi marchali TaxID=326594 RepID=A0AAJ7DXU8_9HYME|nr:PREDICTED: importin subunit alpha-1 [Ceratosolen solmsi marchali]